MQPGAARLLAASLIVLAVPALAGGAEKRPSIAVAEYKDKVYASWLGQCAGNIYGLAHELKYFEQPGPDKFPLGYSGWGASQMRKLNGAFSDDDTDVEYMYLIAMERHGVEPKYSQLASYWKRHVRDKVWLANRAALAAMHHGLTPPWTGTKAYNPHWFQIDPQLVSEIFAVTAPGMIRYATAKSDWAARVMSEDWGAEPTVAYAAMYSAAFFEKDISKLIETGKAALPAGAKFARTIDAMTALHRKHPRNWKAARLEAIYLGFLQEPDLTRTATNANLNAALAILALLYGDGDFQRTLDLACSLGFDADNQAATLGGLLGIVNGTQGIPRALLFPYAELGWTEPFNDRYSVVTREGLPNAGLKDMANRTAALGERIILRGGGRRVNRGGSPVYEINQAAVFSPPLEWPAGPPPQIEAGVPFEYELTTTGAKAPVRWTLLAGSLPDGLRLEGGRIAGTANRPGVSAVTLEARSGKETDRRELKLIVRGKNLALSASRILAPVERADLSLIAAVRRDTPRALFSESAEVIRDGMRTGGSKTFASLGGGNEPRTDFYGYEWQEPQSIGAVAFTSGYIEERTGWFTDLRVEYRDAEGAWRPVNAPVSFPAFPAGASPVDKAHFAEYLFCFEPVATRAVRIIGRVGGDADPNRKLPLFTSIAELSVYGKLPGASLLQ